MKLLHTSDIHLDSPLNTRLPAERVRERKRELLLSFAHLASEAKRLGAEGIIIAGDLFDSEKISKRALDTAVDVISSSPELKYFYLCGNHERRALLESGISLPENLYVFGEGWTYFDFGDVRIAGRTKCEEKMFDSLQVAGGKKNIAVLHGELRDGASAPEVIGRREAAERGIDYIALGHYHSYREEKIDRRTNAVYCGTPEGRGFDEVGKKGFVLIDTAGEGVRHSFISFAKRRLHAVEMDISGAQRISELISRAEARLVGIPSSDLVRIVLVGGRAPDFLYDCETVARTLGGRYYYFEVKDESRLEINPEDYKNDKSLKGEFIRMVSADASLSDSDKDKIISVGLHALMGEEYYTEG